MEERLDGCCGLYNRNAKSVRFVLFRIRHSFLHVIITVECFRSSRQFYFKLHVGSYMYIASNTTAFSSCQAQCKWHAVVQSKNVVFTVVELWQNHSRRLKKAMLPPLELSPPQYAVLQILFVREYYSHTLSWFAECFTCC